MVRRVRSKGLRGQIGKTNIARDRKRTALKPGRRISKSGNRYYEKRANRSDVNRRRRL